MELDALPADRAAAVMEDFARVLREEAARTSRTALADFVNHSGGALGSDRAWGEEAGRFGAVSKHWYRGRRTPFGNAPMTDADFAESLGKATEAARLLGRYWSPKEWVQNLVRRNWCQVKYSDEIFAVGHVLWEPKANGSSVQVKGGTGYAVQMGLTLGKPVHVFDLGSEQWFLASEAWLAEQPPLLSKNFAGIGTRGEPVPGHKGEYSYPAKAMNAIQNVCRRTAEAACPRYGALAGLYRKMAFLAPGKCPDPVETQEGADALLCFADDACRTLAEAGIAGQLPELAKRLRCAAEANAVHGGPCAQEEEERPRP